MQLVEQLLRSTLTLAWAMTFSIPHSRVGEGALAVKTYMVNPQLEQLLG